MAGREVERPLLWLHGEVKTPPFSQEARIEAECYCGGFSRETTQATPQQVIEVCKKRLRDYDNAAREYDS
jgi:hypothetical protein